MGGEDANSRHHEDDPGENVEKCTGMAVTALICKQIKGLNYLFALKRLDNPENYINLKCKMTFLWQVINYAL